MYTPKEHITRIRDALEVYSLSNQRPAVDEAANDFEKMVNLWSEFNDLQDEIKALLKPLTEREQEIRGQLASGLRAFLEEQGKLKEGVNNYALSNGRKLKFGNKMERKIDNGGISVARAAYLAATEKEDFDDLLRVKYELDARAYKKLNDEAKLAVSHMITSRIPPCTMEVD